MRLEAEPEKNLRGAKMKEMHRYNTFKNSFPFEIPTITIVEAGVYKKNSDHRRGGGGLGPC